MPFFFRKRVIEPELLDHTEPEEARRNLADLVRINQRFGGYSTAVKLVSQVAGVNDSFTMLDVGAASGDVSRHLGTIFRKARITSLDANSVNAEGAHYPKLLADAFALPFPSDTFDFVFAALFLHHFTDPQAIQLLSEFRRVAKKAVLLVDLERHILPYWFLPATRCFFKWGSITVHDGMISVRAAFTKAELMRLAAAAGLSGVTARIHRPAFRVSMAGLK